MAYCEVSDVELILKKEYGQSTQPTKARVTQICTNVSAELDGYMAAAGYTVPVTATEALPILQSISEKCAAVQAWHESRDTDAAFPKIQTWTDECSAFKMALRKGEAWLPGLTPESDFEAAFGIAPTIPRDTYFTTGQTLDQE